MAKCPRLLFAPARVHSGDGRNHDAGCDQCVFTNHAGRHADGVAGNKSQQQRCRCGGQRAEKQINCGDRNTTQENIYRLIGSLSPNRQIRVRRVR
jgi:hypothetical protein